MRVDTIIKFHFPFEYWTLQTNLDGTTSYVKKEDRVGMLIPAGQGGAIICAEPMDVPMQIRNVRDRSGKDIYTADGESYPMYVVTSEPQLDPFSNVIAYKHSLRRELPREYSQFIEEVLSR